MVEALVGLEIFEMFATLVISALLTFPMSLFESPNSPFDEYGAISWEDEMARLDNFAIAIENSKDAIGAILVVEPEKGCPGEGEARALRAKRYIVEYRHIDPNRIMWRRDGYASEMKTILLTVPQGAPVPFPWSSGVSSGTDGPMTNTCKSRLRKIKQSKWHH